MSWYDNLWVRLSEIDRNSRLGMDRGSFEGCIHFPHEEEEEVWWLRRFWWAWGRFFLHAPPVLLEYKIEDKLYKN